MNVLSRLGGMAVLLCVGACAAPSSEAPSSVADEADLTGNPWEKKLTCDDGAAVIDADTRTPGRLQLVVRDVAIVKFLQSRVNHVGSPEVIVQGFSESAQDDARSFATFEDRDRFDSKRNANRTRYVQTVGRVAQESGGRVRLAFVEVTTNRVCSGFIDEIYCRNGVWTETSEERLLADWGFQSCE